MVWKLVRSQIINFESKRGQFLLLKTTFYVAKNDGTTGKEMNIIFFYIPLKIIHHKRLRKVTYNQTIFLPW